MSARAPVSSEQSRRVFMAISSLCYVRTKDSVRYCDRALGSVMSIPFSDRTHTHTHVYLNTIRRNIQIMCVCVCVPVFEKKKHVRAIVQEMTSCERRCFATEAQTQSNSNCVYTKCTQ